MSVDQYANHLAEAAARAALARSNIVDVRGSSLRRVMLMDFVTCTATALEEAANTPRCAPALDRALHRLYRAWKDKEGIHLGPAHEHYNDPALPVEQREWLNAFLDLWNEVSPPRPPKLPESIPFNAAVLMAFRLVVDAGYSLLDDGDFEGQDPNEVRCQLDMALSETATALNIEATAGVLGALADIVLDATHWAPLQGFLIETTE